jgi:hypothetical protein
MAQQKVDCVSWFAEMKSVTCIQSKFQLLHGGSAPSCSSIKNWDRCLSETGNVTNQKSPWHPKKKSSPLDKCFYVACTCRFAERACNCIFPTPQFMMMYTNMYIYVHTNCSYDSRSNQPTMIAERDFVRKCCKNLTVMRLSYSLCVYRMRHQCI